MVISRLNDKSVMPAANSQAGISFDLFHPAFAATYFLAVLVLCMSVFHPAFIGVSLLGGILYNAKWRGVRPVLRSLPWQIVAVAVIALANGLFVGAGSTLLLVVGPFPVYFESIAYGACMGMLLVSTMLWFSNAAQVLSSDKVMGLLGGRLPVVGLMVSMVMRLVPQFVRRGKRINDVSQAATSAKGSNVGVGLFGEIAPNELLKDKQDEQKGMREVSKPPAGGSLGVRVRQMSVLMGWSMEDSLETADAMRAQGWGACKTRTSYQARDLRSFDVSAIIVLLALAVASAACGLLACSETAFYPILEVGGVSFAIPYVVLLLVPLVLEVRAWAMWR